MKLLQQHELRVRGSHYFRPTRKHPFIVSLLLCLMSWKRLAKRLKAKVMKIRNKFLSKVGGNFLKSQIQVADRTRYMAQFGSEIVTMSEIKPPVRETIEYREKRTWRLFEDEESALKAQAASVKAARLPEFMSRDRKMKRKLHKMVAEKILKYQMKLNTGKDNEAGTKLMRKISKLEKKLSDKFLGGSSAVTTTLRVSKKGGAGATGSGWKPAASSSSATLTSTLQSSQNAAPQQQQQQQQQSPRSSSAAASTNDPASEASEEERAESVVDYPAGTGIYYGASVSFKSMHGGFLSFHDPKTLAASAYRILSTSKFTIVKAADTTNRGFVAYGDAIWLQAGPNDVLGAAFSGILADEKVRQLRPRLISNSIENRLKSSQYGRWIILNRNFPVETIGKPIGHFDSILLEQEWYYLASNHPENASMYKLKAEMDDVMSGTAKVDLLHPAEECVWTIALAGLAVNASSNESKMAKLSDKATQQIKWSKEHRQHLMLGGAMVRLETSLNPKFSMDALKDGPLLYKQSEYLNQKHLIHYYSDLAANGFSRQPSVEFLKKLYGKGSLIFKMKTEVLNMRAAQIGVEKPPVRIVEIASETPLEEADFDYWQESQKLQVPSEAWAGLQSAMAQFYNSDFDKKVHAIIRIQKAVRIWLRTKFHFGRRFSALDKAAAMKWHKHFSKRQMFAAYEDENDSVASSVKVPHESTLISSPFRRPATSGPGKKSEVFLTSVASVVVTDATVAVTEVAPQPAAAAAAAAAADAAVAAADAVDAAAAVPQVPAAKPALPQVAASRDRGRRRAAVTEDGVLDTTTSHHKSDSAHALPFLQNDFSSPISAQGNGRRGGLNNMSMGAAAGDKQRRGALKNRDDKRFFDVDEGNRVAVAHLARSASNSFGLPRDVFKGMPAPISVSSGVKFLRTRSSSNSALFSDVAATKRRTADARPQTAM